MSTHSRKPSSRATLPRRSTKGPLDGDDPLSPPSSAVDAAPISPAVSKSSSTTRRDSPDRRSGEELSTSNDVDIEDKDLSFLLEPSIYHPLSQLEVPTQFRRELTLPLSATANVEEISEQIDALIAGCNFLSAAHLAGLLLTSGAIKPTDQKHIFQLLAMRYSCLELSGNVLLAAQEAKALEDLGSIFYYHEMPDLADLAEKAADRPLPTHIVPFSLRLQAVRLQSIGFSDPRRGVSALYDVAAECRDYLVSPFISAGDRQLWSSRLDEVGLRVVNALLEMGDLASARRTLDTLRPSEKSHQPLWVVRKAMLSLKMGLLGEVRTLVEDGSCGEAERIVLQSLLAVAEDQFDVAVELLSDQALDKHRTLTALAKQNLAVSLLYRGLIQRARSTLEGLIDADQSFQALTMNLATIYDLGTDRSRDLKIALADKVAERQRLLGQDRVHTNIDFKL